MRSYLSRSHDLSNVGPLLTVVLTGLILSQASPNPARAGSEWVGTSSSWETPGNWNPNTHFPAGNAGDLLFGASGTTATITCATAVTGLTDVTMESKAYTISGSSPGSWTFNDGGSIYASMADQVVAVNILAAGDLDFAMTDAHVLTIGSNGGGYTVAMQTDGSTLTMSTLDIAGIVKLYSPISGPAGSTNITVKLQGAGTFDFTDIAGNSYTGTTVLGSGARLILSADSQLGHSSNDLTINGGTVQYHSGFDIAHPIHINSGAMFDTSTYTASISGVIDGAGQLTKIGAGTLILTGANVYTGGTLVLAGTLQGDSTSLHGSIANDANVTFAQTFNGTYSGNMNGIGTLTKTGTGTLTLSGTNTYSGVTTISAGTLTATTPSALPNYATSGKLSVASGATVAVAAAGWSATQIDALAANPSFTTGNLGIDVAASSTFAYGTPITGGIGFVKLGDGTLTLAGASTYTGATAVNRGTLVVNGSLASNVTVAQNATLGGNGQIGRLTVNGTVTPGNSIGTLTVNGNYVHNSTGTYAVEINDHGGSDLIAATGSATINGGTVDVQAESGVYHPGMIYRILNASSVTGTFANVTDNLPFLNGSLFYGSDYINLILMRSGSPYVDVANTRNQISTANYLDSLYNTASGDLATVFDAINTLTAPDARAAFDQLSGEPYADLAAIDMTGSNLFIDTAFYRLYNGADLDCANPSDRRLWAYGVGNWERQRQTIAGIDSYAGYSNQLAGFMVGCDHQYDNVLLGFAGGYGQNNIGYITSPASDKTDLCNFSCYGKADYGAAYVASVVGYTHGWNNMTRIIRIDDLATRQATASVGGNVFGTLLQAGYNIEYGNWRLTPLAGMRYGYGGMANATETGADSVNLVVGNGYRNSLTGHMGSRLAFCMNRRWRAETYGQWEHEYSDTYNDVTMAFAGSPGDFRVRSVMAERDAVRTGVTAIGDLNQRISVHVNYDALLRASYASQQFTGGLSIGF